MPRRIFTILAAVSLLLCSIACTLWFAAPSSGQTWHFTYDTGSPATQNNIDLTLSPRANLSLTSNRWNRWTFHHLTLPAAPVALVCLILPVLWLVRERFSPPGACVVCGYDLRASPERCPECGNPVAKPSQK